MTLRKNKLESEIENYFVTKCHENNIIIVKLTGLTGIPDRLIIGYGRQFFIELKRPGEVPKPHQVERISQLQKRGATVFVADSKEQVDDIINKLMEGRNLDGSTCRKRKKTNNTEKHAKSCTKND